MRLNAMWCHGLGPRTQNVLEKLEHPNKVCSLVHGNAVFLVMTNAPQRCEVITLQGSIRGSAASNQQPRDASAAGLWTTH